jgi:hypothetical protein
MCRGVRGRRTAITVEQPGRQRSMELFGRRQRLSKPVERCQKFLSFAAETVAVVTEDRRDHELVSRDDDE